MRTFVVSNNTTMKRNNRFFSLIMIATTAFAFGSCNNGNLFNSTNDTLCELSVETASVIHDTIVPEPEPEPVVVVKKPEIPDSVKIEQARLKAEAEARKKEELARQKEEELRKQEEARKKAEAEKKKQNPIPLNGVVYVQTHGANGQVYGHITMNGNKGEGQIYDGKDNAIKVTATRHGNELYATDINGRQYVFKF